MKLSVVIPAHNEEETVRPTIDRLCAALTAEAIPFEILVVNDHSTDGTARELDAVAREHPEVRWTPNLKPGGFGLAVQTGLEQFSGDAVCIVMADASDDPADVVQYYRKLEEGFECVFGTRFSRKSRVVDYPRHKLIINRLANWFINILFQLHFNDTTNAFKAYRREVIEGVGPILSSHFNITVELPLKAITRGYTYTTVPINWYNRAAGVSKLKVQEMGSRYLFIVLYVWLEKWLSRGDYQRLHRHRPSAHAEIVVPAAREPASHAAREPGRQASLTIGRLGADDPTQRSSATTTVAVDVPLVPQEAMPQTVFAQASAAGTPAEGMGTPPDAAPEQATGQRGARRWMVALGAMLIAAALIVSRRPDALFNPQFWAEDGLYYAQAYNNGAFPATVIPIAGYVLIIPRLVAIFAMLFPVSAGPLIFNLFGLLLQVLPVGLLFSGRFDRIIPSRLAQALIAVLYVAIPNSYEINVTLTNSQWHVALAAFMIVIADPPRRQWAKVADFVFILLAGLTGPFCVALAPILALRWLQLRTPRLAYMFVLNLATALVQFVVLMSVGTQDRPSGPLGANLLTLLRLLAGQIVVGATMGQHVYNYIFQSNIWASNKVVVVVAAIGLALFVLALVEGTSELRLLIVFGLTIFGLSLRSPLTGHANHVPAWELMLAPGLGVRYEYFAMLAFLVSIVWLMCGTRHTSLRSFGVAALLATFVIGIPLDWTYPAYKDLHYQTYVQRFAALPPGAQETIPINPGGPWHITLVKGK